MSDTALATRGIHELLEKPSVRNELKKALPKHLNPERLIRIAATAIQRSSRLKQCTPISLLACVIETAQLGLEPDGVLGESYFVPFKNKKTQQYSATLIPGYKGLMKLIFQTGTVQAINVELVRAGETFGLSLGTQRGLTHKPKLELRGMKDDTEARWHGVYATVTYKNGVIDFEYMTAAEVAKIRARSQAASDGPWVTDTEAMWKKTAIRRLAKRLPKSTTDHMLSRAVALDELAEAERLVPTTHGFEIAEMSESTEAEETPIERTTEVASEPEPQTKAKKGKKAAPANGASPTTASGIPRAVIPKGEPIDVTPEKTSSAATTAKDDPIISSPECTNIYNAAVQHGWKVPEEVSTMLQNKFKVEGVTRLRRSQIPKVLEILVSGT